MKQPHILQEDENRFVIFPIKYSDIWEYYKTARALSWNVEEFTFTGDKFDQLNDDEKHYLKMVLAFFAASDGIVNENLAENMLKDVQYAEAKFFYGEQIAMENVHSETYSLLIDTYIKDSEEKDKLFNALSNFPSIRKKADWALNWIENGSFVHRLLAFACVEGIFFSSSFASIYWLDHIHSNLLPSLKLANDFISRDEGLHCDFACLLYNNYIEDEFKLSESEIHKMLLEAFEVEKEFVLKSLPVRLIGMNSDLMVQYLKYVVDQLCTQLNVSKIFNVKQPIKFMEQLALEGKTNFFEKRASEYQRAGVKDSVKDSNNDLDLFSSDF